MRSLSFILGSWLLLALGLAAAETLPPKPEHYFNDYAHVVSPAFAQSMEEQLTQFEKDTSNQVVVAIYPKLDSSSSVEDFTQKTAQSWQVGQKEKRNGAVFFVFIAEHKDYIQVGYGLEGSLPDATCKDILIDKVQPAFKAGNYEAGLQAGVTSIMQATRGEYKGSGRTAGDSSDGKSNWKFTLIIYGLIILFAIISSIYRRKHGVVYGNSGSSFATGWLLSSLFSGGGGSSGGGGGGGGGFSGGGGSFGGGGAGGSW